MIFHDRIHAAFLLAEKLSPLKGVHPLILAIPRGAVAMGRVLADALEGQLDVVLVRKLGFPGNPEYAIGAIDEDGHRILDAHVAGLGVSDAYVEEEAARQLRVLKARRAQIDAVHPRIDPADRTVIVIDDGLATGSTMAAALHSVRLQKPARLIAAVPVASPSALQHITPLADETACLQAPPDFAAVGQYYDAFAQVTDAEVLELLANANG